MNTILVLAENPIDKPFLKSSVAGKEIRLRAASSKIDAIWVISRPKITSSEFSGIKKVTTIHTIPWPYYASSVILFAYGLIYALKHKPSFIEAESPPFSGLAAYLLKKLINIPYAVEYRASYTELMNEKVTWIPYSIKQKVFSSISHAVLNNATVVIANSTHYKRTINTSAPIITINPGIQTNSYPPPKKHSKAVVVGFLGRLEKEKGILLFTKLAETLKDYKNISFKVAGTGSMESYVKKHCARYKNSTYLGWQKSKQFLKSIDVLINPNTVDHPLEMVNIEAASMRIPVITFGDAKIPETVIDMESGIKVATKSTKHLKKALLKLINSPSLYEHLSVHAIDHLHKYDQQKQATRLIEAYTRFSLLH